MKNRIVLILASIVFAIVLVLALRYPGEVVVKLTGYPSLAINLYFFIVVLIVFGIVLGGIIKLIAGFVKLPTRLRQTHHRHQTKKGEQVFCEGLHLYLQGDYTAASRLLMKTAQSKTNPRLIAALFAADAALLDNDIKTARKAITLSGVSPGEDAAADIVAAEIAVGDEAPESAAFRVNNIIDKKSGNLRASRILIKLCEKSGAWHLAEQALWQLDRALHDAPRRRQYIRIQIISALLRQAVGQKNKQQFNRWWQQADEATKEELLELYISSLAQLGDIKEAEHYLEKMITHDYNERAIEQYGMLSDSGAEYRIKRTEQWLKQHPENAALLRCLARLYKTTAQPDKAREYLEKSLAIKQDYETWRELNKLA
ncbi:MAG: hypothetical protein F4Y58_02890 [Gammaproteobacteria bacterium]|nr:hypothetical protein [Gammaproteobacteria bacterium]